MRVGKEFHELSKMLISTALFPRPRSDSNGSEQGPKPKSGDKDSGPSRPPMSLPLNPLKKLQSSFNKSDTLYPPPSPSPQQHSSR